MSIEAHLREESARWERRQTAVTRLLPYALLAVCTAVTLLQAAPVPLLPVLGLTLAAAVWTLWFLTLRPQWHGSRPLMGLFYVGLTITSAALVLLAPWYGMFAVVGYVYAFLFLEGGWRYVGVVVTSPIMAVAYMGGVDRIDPGEQWLWLAISFVSAGLAAACFRAVEVTDLHGRRQAEALSALHRANVSLEDALDENARLHGRLLGQAREAGVLDERQRMAREIHDTLAQALAGILTQLQVAEQTAGEPAVAHRHLTRATGLAREALVEARRTVHAVEPQLLAEARLPDAIGNVARQWSEANHVDAELTTTGDARPMHTEVEATLLRTAQEALANVAKHAHAGRVGLTLSYMDDTVTLDVRDDGVGFEPTVRGDGLADGGFGLAGMRQRVQRLSGRLQIESEPGGGTAVSASVPAIPAGGAR